MSGIGWDDYYDCPLWQFTEEELAERDAQIRADTIEKYKNVLHSKYNENKVFAYSVCDGDIYKYESLANLDLEEIDEIAEQLKGNNK